jgi:hypothetical protein
MITKVTGFLSSIGNIFKTKEEALRQERELILKKFMLKKETKYEYDYDRNCYSRHSGNCKSITTFVPDQETINQFLDNYDDIMAKLKEVDNSKDA